MGAIRKCEQRGEGDEIAQRHDIGGDLARAHVHDHGAHRAHQNRCGKAHEGSRGQALQDVIEQPLHAGLKHLLFALFGMIALHHAHAAQRFGQPSGYLRIDLAAIAENGPDGAESFAQNARRTR